MSGGDTPTLAYHCPHDRSALTATADALTCASCGDAYPIVRGVPRFVPHDAYAASFGLQWNRHRRAQLDSYTGLSISRDRLFAVTGWPRRMEGEHILEAGCGAGRFTEVLASTGAQVYSFDLSSAVEANAANHGHLPNVRISQASITAIPFPAGAFDRVLCLGVLQHTPDPAAAFRALAAMVRPGGAIVVDIYRKSFTALLHWKYLLRPITKRLPEEVLYRMIARGVPALLPATRFSRRCLGRVGARLFPIAEYSHLGLPEEFAREWAILDTFDMYSPRHDHPQTRATVSRWFRDARFVDVDVRNGPNGIIGLGTCPNLKFEI